ncbi:hypothetical protein QFZ37_003461 [Chryseobacterium ginsenosidimutans]|nr:hypothetical protein [Chryseobacterium ginsenosidimutans]
MSVKNTVYDSTHILTANMYIFLAVSIQYLTYCMKEHHFQIILIHLQYVGRKRNQYLA